ncbi:hypothetical protein [Brevibacillus porteri]|uniref:hypothetical protein n=1 Tax=Brevibacillus porteri TaxID=2126350 RepID=UPI003D1DF2DE
MWNPLEVKDLITSADELKSLVGEPHEAVVKKSIAQVESHVIHYVSMSPLFFLSTADASGRCDVSPRGDELVENGFMARKRGNAFDAGNVSCSFENQWCYVE